MFKRHESFVGFNISTTFIQQNISYSLEVKFEIFEIKTLYLVEFQSEVRSTAEYIMIWYGGLVEKIPWEFTFRFQVIAVADRQKGRQSKMY